MRARRLRGAISVAGFAAIFIGFAAAPASAATAPGTYPVYCSGSTATSFTGCYADGQSNPLSVPAGSQITTDPSVPSTATATTGLVAPDGILGTIPSTMIPSTLGIPAGATTFLYIDKQVNYFIPGTATNAVTLPLTTPTNIAVTGDYTKNFGTGPNTFYLGGSTTNTIRSVSCTSVTPTALMGCTSNDGSAADAVKAGFTVGGPNSCITPGSVLQEIGEGSTNPKTLFKNNEDYASVRIAYTTDGLNFHDITPAAGIQGLGSPFAQAGIRWISPGGSIINNGDGTIGVFYSEGQCTDGDSDAFGSVYYSTSTDGGLTWSTGVQIHAVDPGGYNNLLSTDYTYAASIADQGTNKPLDVSAYYEGRIYSPSVVQNPDGTLTMSFAGYRTSKPLPATGSAALPIGRASENSTQPATVQYTPQANEPDLYRNILTVQLTKIPGSNPAQYTAGTPQVAQVENGPWVAGQGDPSQPSYTPNGGASLITYTPGGTSVLSFGGATYPNLATYPGSGAGAGTAAPYTTAYAGSPGPLAGYCTFNAYPVTSSQQAAALAAKVNRQPANTLEPMSPYYFPHIEINSSGGLTGYFDYRPKDSDEAIVIATSNDHGLTWQFQSESLELSQGHCPWGNADAALQTTTDDGEGHPSDLTVNGVHYLYTVVRANGVLDTLGSEFLAHNLANPLPSSEPTSTNGLTTSTGSNTVTNQIGGVSTSTFNVGSTATFGEIPGRIYVTIPPATPGAPTDNHTEAPITNSPGF